MLGYFIAEFITEPTELGNINNNIAKPTKLAKHIGKTIELGSDMDYIAEHFANNIAKPTKLANHIGKTTEMGSDMESG